MMDYGKEYIGVIYLKEQLKHFVTKVNFTLDFAKHLK